MRRLILFPLLAGLMLLMACEPVISLHPLYTEKDLVFEPALLGCWGEEGEEEEADKEDAEKVCVFTFEAAGEKAYKLTIQENEGVFREFRAHLLRLGEALFLDVQPVWPEEADDEIYQAHHVAGHSFHRLWLEKDVFHYAPLREEWVSESLESGLIDISHARILDGDEGQVVLTGMTQELQAFVGGLAENKEAFDRSEAIYRLR